MVSKRGIGLAFRESFGFKMLSSFIIVIVVTMTVYTAFGVVRESRKAKESLRAEGELIAGLLARTAVVGIFSENKNVLSDAAAGVLVQKDVLSVSMYNADLRLLFDESKQTAAGELALLGPQSGTDTLTMVETSEIMEFLQPVRSGGRPVDDESIYFGPAAIPSEGKVIGYVRILLSKKAYRRETIGLVIWNLFAMAVFVIASAVVVSVAVKRILRPLSNLTATARALEAGLDVPPLNIRSRDEIGNLATAFNAMIEARGKAEESLRESEERYRRLVELSPDAIIVVDGGLFTFLNAAAVRLLGTSGPESLLGTDAIDILPHEDRPYVMDQFRRVEQEGTTVSFLQLRYLRLDGTVADVEAAVAPFSTPSNRAVLVIARDVTERKALENRVRSYERELREATQRMSLLEMRVEERERHLIATDLHDYVGQNLVASQFKLGMLKRTLSSADILRQIEEIHELLAETIQYTRSLTVELSSPVLVEIGLVAAVRSLAEGFERLHGLTVHVQDDEQPKPVPDTSRYVLFRCLRELLMNVVKHAETAAATVTLTIIDETLRIVVRDDGKGFEPSAAAGENSGFGLFAIRERISGIGGVFEIESKPGRGTTVVLSAPLIQTLHAVKGEE